MKRILKRALTSAALAAVLASPLAHATNGYFKIGAGAQNRGMAGAGIAYGQDGIAAAVNPASIAFVGSRIDAGVEVFKPKRDGRLDATGMGGVDSDEKSRSNKFLLPSFGMTKDWSNKITLGLSAIGNGGMNTRYGDANTGNGNIYSTAFGAAIPGFVGNLILGGADPGNTMANAAALGANPNNSPALGINLAQLLISPTIAYKITPNHSIGFGPVIGYQAFRAYGLGLFQGLSSAPGKVTNNGNDSALGLGGQIGYQGNFGVFSFGLMGRSKIYMDEFDDYAGLFAEQGDFDIPATFGGGIAIHFSQKLTLAADVTRILYGDVKAIANKGPTADELFNAFAAGLTNGDPVLPPGAFGTVAKPLGSDNGWGFGWDDITVYKIGVDYAYSTQWTLRAGFNYAEVPYDADQAMFNILAPAVVEKHATASFTYNPTPNNEFTVTYMHAFENDLKSTYQGTGPNAAFSYTASNKMYQDAIEVAYGWKF